MLESSEGNKEKVSSYIKGDSLFSEKNRKILLNKLYTEDFFRKPIDISSSEMKLLVEKCISKMRRNDTKR